VVKLPWLEFPSKGRRLWEGRVGFPFFWWFLGEEGLGKVNSRDLKELTRAVLIYWLKEAKNSGKGSFLKGLGRNLVFNGIKFPKKGQRRIKILPNFIF